MQADITTLKMQAALLPPMDRVRLIESLQESLEVSDTGIQQAWALEAEDRLDALERGEIQTQDEPQVLRDFRARRA